MPFKSEKQRKYLWANEPEIARDWTDTYGSGIAKALGGRIGFANGNFLGLPQHYQNTDQLRAATRAGLISEPQYKEMSGHDAAENVWGLGNLMGPLQPYANVAASTLYNVDKSIRNPQDYFDPDTYQPRIGPMESIDLNVKGATEGLSPELKEKYEGILGLDRKSLTGNWMPEDLYDFSNVDDDDEKGTIAFDPNNPQVNRSMIFNPLSALGIGALKGGAALKNYLKNMFISKAVGKQVGKYTRPFLKQQMMKFAGIDPRARMPFKHKDKSYQYDPTLQTIFKEEIGGAESKIKPTTKEPYVSRARPHGNGGGGPPGSMPTGTAGRNPWGRAKGGLVSLWQR